MGRAVDNLLTRRTRELALSAPLSTVDSAIQTAVGSILAGFPEITRWTHWSEGDECVITILARGRHHSCRVDYFRMIEPEYDGDISGGYDYMRGQIMSMVRTALSPPDRRFRFQRRNAKHLKAPNGR